MTSKLLLVALAAALTGLTADLAVAQQNKNQGNMAAKCRAQVAKALPGGDITMKGQKQRLFRVCMQNGGRL